MYLNVSTHTHANVHTHTPKNSNLDFVVKSDKRLEAQTIFNPDTQTHTLNSSQ